MGLHIDIGQPDWMEDDALRARLAPLLPGVAITTGPPEGPMPGVRMLALSRLAPGGLEPFPALELVQKLGAGVESVLGALRPGIRVARLRPDAQARQIAEWCLAHVLARHRHLARYRADQEAARWAPVEPVLPEDRPVLVLGAGAIGAAVARAFAANGFPATCWRRSPGDVGGVPCTDGPLAEALAGAEIVVAALPSTPATAGLLDAGALGAMRPGALLLNVGRGDLVDEAALMAALDVGRPGHAVLDVLREEPLPPGDPLWRHPGVTITPHVSGWHLGEALDDVADNWRALAEGRPLRGEVDPARAY